MTKARRDPAELAALIEQRVSRGIDLVDSFLAVTGKGSRASSKTLALEHHKAVAANKREVARHRTRVGTLRTEVTGGAVVAGVGGSIGLIDVLTGSPSSLWLWFGAAGVGLVVSLRARARLRKVGPAPRELALVGPPPAIPRSAVGSAEVSRFTSVRVQIMNMAPSLERLYPGAGDELRRADNEAAGPLTALAERLVVLDQLQRELPGTSAAVSAARRPSSSAAGSPRDAPPTTSCSPRQHDCSPPLTRRAARRRSCRPPSTRCWPMRMASRRPPTSRSLATGRAVARPRARRRVRHDCHRRRT